MPDFIYLASQSPRRSQLLEQLGVRHELLLPNAHGDEAEDAEAIEAVARRSAHRLRGARDGPQARCRRATPARARVAARCAHPVLRHHGGPGRTIYGKPDDAAHAQRMLASWRATAPRAHRRGVQWGAKRLTALSVSRVTLPS
jgi:septum formation protein